MKAFIVLTLVAVISAAFAQVDYYDCSGKPNGDYSHPVDCTRFITCSNGYAYEMNCAQCSYDPVRCPDGRLIFDQNTDQCLWAHEANCVPGGCRVAAAARKGRTGKFL